MQGGVARKENTLDEQFQAACEGAEVEPSTVRWTTSTKKCSWFRSAPDRQVVVPRLFYTSEPWGSYRCWITALLVVACRRKWCSRL